MIKKQSYEQNIFTTGAPGAGKTTIGRRVAEQFPKSIHIKVDDLQASVVSGAIFSSDWTEEATKQFRLARTTADGFTAVVCRKTDGIAPGIDVA